MTVVLEHVAEGESWEKILANYPELTREDIHDALMYARASLDHMEIEAINAWKL